MLIAYMGCSTIHPVQYRTIQYGTVRYCTLRYNMVWYGTVHYGMYNMYIIQLIIPLLLQYVHNVRVY